MAGRILTVRMLRNLFPVLLILLAALLRSNAAEAEKRVALVIGNAAYANAPRLANPLNDAKAVADRLKGLGFEVHLAHDATRQQTLKALDEFAAALPGAAAALLYYSGHGLQLEGANYLLPIDIEVSSERSVRYGAIDIAEVVHDMEQNADVSLVVLDACRDNPFLKQLAQSAGGRSVAASRGLAPIKPSGSGTIVAYSAAAGAVASDGTADHSPYTAAFLDQVAEPNVEVGLMFRRVAGKVVEATGGEQRPEVLISLTREYYMKLEPEKPAAVAVAATDQPRSKPVSPPEKATSAGGAAPAVETPAVGPPSPVTSQPAAIAAIATKPPVPDTAAKAAERGNGPVQAGSAVPYAATLARLDFNKPLYQPPAPWSAPKQRVIAESEPSDSAGTANPIEVNDLVKLSIEPVGDGDWFYFNVGAAGVLTVRAEHQPAEIDLVVRMVDADRRVVSDWKATPRPGGVLDVSFDVPAAGAYWLEIRDGNNDAHSPQTIDVALSFAAQEDLSEPDNAPSQARAIAAAGSRRVNIFPIGDADFFLIGLDRPGELAVSATEVPQDLDVVMRLLDADQNVVRDWVVPPRPGGDTDAVFAIKQPGFYFLEVRDGNNDHGSVQAFTLTSSFSASPDRYEPNDSIAAATALPATGEATLTIFPQGEVDWLKIDVDHPGELQLSATGVPDNLDVVFRVLAADQRDLTGWIVPPRLGGDTSGIADLPQSGSYFIEVRDSNNDAGSVKPFKFASRFTASADQYELNDTMGQATDVRPGGALGFSIFPIGDGDWFKVAVDQPGELALAIDEGPKNLDLTFHVLDADRRDLTGWVPAYAKGGLTEGRADLKAPGAYYIEVRDSNNDARSIQSATLSTRFTPGAAGHEPDDTFGTAAKLPLSGSNPGYILPLGDTDWEVVYAEQAGEFSVTVDQVPEQLDVAFHVLDADQRDLSGWLVPGRKGGDTVGKVKIEKPGWYWIQFADANNDGRSPLPFRITREFTAGAAP